MAAGSPEVVPLTRRDHAVSFAVRVIPRARRTAIDGVRAGALVVRLNAPPVDGAANDALVAFLAGVFGRPKRDVSIVSGQTSRDKRVAIANLADAEVASRLFDILASL
jgi:uncharacterized protein